MLDDGAINVVLSMRGCISELNISNNKLTDNTIRALLNWIEEP